MPSDSENATTDDPDGAFPAIHNASSFSAVNNTEMGALTCSTVGGGQPFPKISPFQVVNFIIALVGIYPSED